MPGDPNRSDNSADNYLSKGEGPKTPFKPTVGLAPPKQNSICLPCSQAIPAYSKTTPLLYETKQEFFETTNHSAFRLLIKTYAVKRLLLFQRRYYSSLRDCKCLRYSSENSITCWWYILLHKAGHSYSFQKSKPDRYSRGLDRNFNWWGCL